MTVRAADGAAVTSAASTIASFLEPITGIFQFIAVVVAIVAGIFAIVVHRRNLRK